MTITKTTQRPTGHPTYSRTMPRAAPSAADARRLVRTALADWDLDGLADAAVLLVSELTGNAVRHTRCRAIKVTVSRTGQDRVRIAVTDKSRALPVRRDAASYDVGGRGLVVVAELTARWGTDPLPWGKRVWGELRRPGR